MSAEKKDTIVSDITRADFALQEAMENAGMEAKTYGIWGFFWRLSQKRGARVRHAVKKKTYILLLIFTGWFGGHRFYAKRRILGGIYLALFWTLIPFMMAVLDLLEVIPMKSDENGIIIL